MKESELERILVTEVRKLGGRAYKFISPGNDGVPDRIVMLPAGKIYFVELKTRVGQLRPQQRIQMKRINDMGQSALVIKGTAGLIWFFRHIGQQRTADYIAHRYGGDE